MSNYEKNDNTRVAKLVKHPLFKRTISSEEKELMRLQGYIWDGEKWVFMGTISQGEGSPDNKTLLEKAKNYWKFSGASDRWKTSLKTGQNPVKGTLDVGLGYTHPILAGVNTLYDMYNAYDLLNSPQGLAKTWGLIRSGNLGKAAVSAAGDALVASDLIPGMPEIPSVRSVSTPEIRIPNRGNVAGETVIPAMNITDSPVDMSSVRAALNSADNVRIQLPPSLDNFNNRLLSLINEVSNNQERLILQLISEGNWERAHYLYSRFRPLWNRKYEDLIKTHPDSRYLNNSNFHDNLKLIIAILKLRNIFKEGLAPIGDDIVRALGSNPYDDNPLIEELGRSNFTDNYDILPAETRGMFEGQWNPANNHIINDMIESNYLAPDNHPYQVLRGRFRTNYEVPIEYKHLNTDIYDGSYPLEYYTGVETPDNLNADLLLEYGILGETSGLFTEELLKNLTPEALDRFLRKSSKLDVEGAHGDFFNPYSDPLKQALQYLLTKGLRSEDIMKGLKRSNRSGYVNIPHSLSIDSWPIWELQSLRHSNNTIPISPELFSRTDYAKKIPYRDGRFWGITNTYGIGNRIEASSDLQKFIKTHLHDKLDINDFTITPIDDQVSEISHKGESIGTLKMLNYDETLNKFNKVRRKLYRSDPSKYPGDAEAFESRYDRGWFRFRVPFIPTLLKKKGGKLNVRLVRRNTN